MITSYSSAGKGDKARPFSDYKRYSDNFDEISNMGKDTFGAKIEQKLQQQQELTSVIDLSEQKPQ
jgi:hypothetical protein